MKQFSLIIKKIPAWFYLALLILLGIAGTALGQAQYTPLIGIPGVTNSDTTSIGEYINALYIMTISLGGLIGVVKIGMAGVKYSMSDVITDKGQAKEDIQGVLIGLAILLIPFIVLNTIYPGLTNLDVLKLAPKVELKPSGKNAPVDGGGGIGTGPVETTYTKQCGYTPSYGSCSDEINGCPALSWDDSACKKQCADLDGTFTDLNGERSKCVYVNTGPVIPLGA